MTKTPTIAALALAALAAGACAPRMRPVRAVQPNGAIVRSTQDDDIARARMGREHGAQYMLQGDISQINDREGGRRVVYYQVDMTLIDLETNAKTWTGQHKIKKMVEQPRFRL
ncbi:MAG TPA: hypothetical protein VF771_16305 [Longimicrobiaceae bacterium]